MNSTPLKSACSRSRTLFDFTSKSQTLEKLESRAAESDFWNDSLKAKDTMAELAALRSVVNPLSNIESRINEMLEMVALCEEDASASDLIPEIESTTRDISTRLQELEKMKMFSDELDPNNAYLSINPGAGGTEAQDWAEILLRMYLRYCEHKGWQAEMIDHQAGEGAGIKSATFLAKGPFAYGHLKAEIGVHRLVRISPFDANQRRHTSFASVFVTPEVSDDVQVEIRDADLRIDTYRAGGAGGQHVNKTDSAVRITHLPTGIVVQCQNERSQHQNKAVAMKILRSKLYEIELEKSKEFEKEAHSKKKKIEWGSQIRSYVLHPYRMIKDHRTGVETGNVDPILDGKLDEFIEAFLLS